MANNFDDDARIIEYWLFENNLTAGKAGNNLTASAGGVGYESGTPMEGAYSLDLEYGSNQWASRADADLSSGFPLKSGDTVKKVSWAFWVKIESITATVHYIVSKYNVSSKRCLTLLVNQAEGKFSLLWGHTGGAGGDNYYFESAVVGRKYHVGIAVDGIAKTALIRLYDDSTSIATTYNHTYDFELYVSDAAFVVGDRGNMDGTLNYDGMVDELVIANDLFSADEMDAIRNGTFGASASFSPSISPSPSASTSLSPSLSLSLSPSKSPSVPATTGRNSFLIF